MPRPQLIESGGDRVLVGTEVISPSISGVSGHLYIAHISNTRALAAATVSSVTGLGLTWTQLTSQCSGVAVNQHRYDIWYAIGAATTGNVTVTFSTTVNEGNAYITRWGSVDTADPIGQIAAYNTNGSAGACTGGVASDDATGSMTVEGTQSVVVAAAVTDELTIYTMTGGWTEIVNYGGGSAEAFYLEYRSAQPGALTFGAANNLSGADQWAMVAVEIRGEPIAAAPARTVAQLFDPATGAAIRALGAWQ